MVYNFSRIKEYFYSGCSYILKLEKVFGPPAKIHIEITNICNFRCIYCPQSIPDEHFKILGRGKMSYETYKAIVDKLVKAYRIRRIVLTRDGEPLVHPELENFVKYNTQKGLKTSMGSNGSLITDFSSSGKMFKEEKINYNLSHHPWLEMIIDYKGNVVGYCRDLRSEYQLGNILDTNDIAKNIWNGQKMRYLRKNLSNRYPENINICKKCDLPYGVSYAGSSIPKKIVRFFSK